MSRSCNHGAGCDHEHESDDNSGEGIGRALHAESVLKDVHEWWPSLPDQFSQITAVEDCEENQQCYSAASWATNQK